MVPSSFTCFRIYKNGQKIQGRLEKTRLNELSAGEVVIKAHYSSINFKDALAASGRAKIMRHFPLIGGIDLAGELVSSESPEFEVGQKVLVTGCGLGETSDGAYSEYVRVPASWVLPLPDELSPKEAMILGTAGFTAALCLARLKANGQSPEQGPLLVTGASGGVGMIAVQILSQQSFEVVAVSSKAEHHDLLRKLGACHTLTPQQLELDTTALSSARWAGAIDNVGGQLLSQIFPHIQLWGNIACVGMAGGSQLQTSIYPLILRGVSLLGISSTNCPRALREDLWKKLATSWKPRLLSLIHTQTVTLSQLKGGFQLLLDRKAVGRTLVQIHPD